MKKIIADAKSSGCVDCGEIDPVVLEFHHRDPEEKSFTIGSATGTESVPKLIAEIAKCDVVCANDHRRRQAKLNMATLAQTAGSSGS